jgi:hypothetical protein
MKLSEQLINRLKELSNRETWEDQFDDITTIDDFAGGNIDDAYNGGVDDGMTNLAREILEELGM